MHMPKPLKFHQTLNQAPRSARHGKHRRAGAPAHRHSTIGTDYSAGGSGTTWYSFAGANWTSWSDDPKPPTVPHAGIRTGELIGYRLWWVIGFSICSLAHRRLWEPDETVYGDIAKPVQPGYGTFGGTYAFHSAAQLQPEIETEMQFLKEVEESQAAGLIIISTWGGWNAHHETRTLVSGTVKMWGEVVEHERGYRAEFAKLNSLDAIYGPGDLDALRTRYLRPQR